MNTTMVATIEKDTGALDRSQALDDEATVGALDAARAVFGEQIAAHGGRVVDMAGDSVLAVFETANGAVSSALAAQAEINRLADTVPTERGMRFRIGVHLGDVIEKVDGSVYGNGVNIAARLEGLAETGGITISDAVRGAVKGKVTATFVDQGQQLVKNIADPIQAYRVRVEGPSMLFQTRIARVDRAGATANIDLSLPDKPSIAVLSFSNISADTEQEYFVDGITEDIITELARFHELFVISRNSTFTYNQMD